MFKYKSKWKNRRSSHGYVWPILFLIFEITLYLLSIYLISQFNMLLLTLISAFVAIYLFITSSLVRFRSVCYRQKFQNEDNSLMTH